MDPPGKSQIIEGTYCSLLTQRLGAAGCSADLPPTQLAEFGPRRPPGPARPRPLSSPHFVNVRVTARGEAASQSETCIKIINQQAICSHNQPSAVIANFQTLKILQ